MSSWLQLKLQMLPSISNEIRNRITDFNHIVKDIDEQNDTTGAQWAELLQEYSRLRAQMKARMEELSIFYDENLDDEKIIFFEKLRLKIKKTLHNRPGKLKIQQGEDVLEVHDDEFFENAPLS